MVWLTGAGLGVGLLGVAAITLGIQAIRKLFDMRVKGFWVLVGLGCAIAGLWEWLDVQQPLAPIILIVVGVGLFVWRVWPKTRHRSDS